MCISLHQPWASALFVPDDSIWHAVKLHETRGRKMPAHYVNQWVGVHAAKTEAIHTRRAWASLVEGVTSTHVLFANEGIAGFHHLPRGCVIGKIMFGPSAPADKYANAESLTRTWGDYGPGRWIWPVVQFELFEKPIPAIGRQGWFDVDLSAAVPADHGSNIP
jgi:hypothetical protein